MKKQVQENINEICKEYYGQLVESLSEKPAYSCKPLRHCQAKVFDNGEYLILQSYKTVVAFIVKRNSSFVDVLRLVYGFTSTSCQHIAKFRSDYGRNCVNYYTYRAV